MTGPRLGARRHLIDGLLKAKAKIRNPRVSTKVAADENGKHPDKTLRLYFEIGESALEQIRDGMHAAGVSAPRRILDAPSGYGRVLRYLKAQWPDADVTALELLPDAVRFCAETFGARPVLSGDPIWMVPDVGDNFDLVFCGSLLTHFDRDAWLPVLEFFRDRLGPNGVLVFTTHGKLSIDVLARVPDAVAVVSGSDYGMGAEAQTMADEARQTGFAFRQYYATQTGTPWGMSVSSPDWVRATVASVSGLEFVKCVERGWLDHQDVWTYKRSD